MKEEKVIETKTCRHCNSKFEITDRDLEFYEKVSPVFAGVKYGIPTPTLCPDCRQQRRLSFRNERNLYKRKCDATGKNIISIYSPDKPYKVFSQEEWWSDNWNALDYGRDFDFSRSFFEQFEELLNEVPKPNLTSSNNENSDYTNYVSYLRDCYLVSSSDYSENCINGSWIENSKNCVDCNLIDKCENCYEVSFSQNIFKSSFVLNSSNCSNSDFLYDCRGCMDCFMCFGLRNKQFYIDNKSYSKEDYEIKMKEIKASSDWFFANKEDFLSKLKNTPRLYINKNGIVENSTGDYLLNTTNTLNSYCVIQAKDCKNILDAFDVKSSQDSTNVNGELGYENCESFPMPFKGCFNFNTYNGSDIIYTMFCMSNCKYLFGCAGLKGQSYCILNKQYTKEEYEELVPKIIEHMKKPIKSPLTPFDKGGDEEGVGGLSEWGEFFPSSISPFGYNETGANEHFLLSKEKSLKKGFKRSDYENPLPQVSKTIPANKLPNNIQEIPDDILNWAIECEITNKPFRIIKQELEFYRKRNLPIPKRHPDQRHLDRMKLRNERKLYDRKCDKCSKEIKTTYSLERTEIVYCEECYEKEVVD